MTESIEFDVVHEYDLYEIGITVAAELRSGEFKVDTKVRIDTGSTYCIFKRHLGEGLDVEIESGIPALIGTVTGSFRAYGHLVTLTVLGIEFDTTVYFAESDLFDRNVLGRIGWLDRVKFGLIEPEGKLFVSPYRK